MSAAEASPPASPLLPLTTTLPSSRMRTSPKSPRSPRSPSGLSLDLSDLPPLVQPTPPSNTLLITGLLEPSIFHPANLEELRNLINSPAPIYSWSPLKSFKRIIVVFYSTDDAILIRSKLDGEAVMGCRMRVFFGEPTNLNPQDQHLQAPKSDKLFFISPPPSPPHGWEMRNEEPPNKEVHAEDLAQALAKLHARPEIPRAMDEDGTPDIQAERRRSRSGSTTIVYHPKEHGDSPDLPAISVEDTTDEANAEVSPMEGIDRPTKMFATARPPVELMHDA